MVCVIAVEEEHPDGPYAYQINPGNRIRFDSANISSATYHLNMVKKLIAESSEAEQRDQEVKVVIYYFSLMALFMEIPMNLPEPLHYPPNLSYPSVPIQCLYS